MARVDYWDWPVSPYGTRHSAANLSPTLGAGTQERGGGRRKLDGFFNTYSINRLVNESSTNLIIE